MSGRHFASLMSSVARIVPYEDYLVYLIVRSVNMAAMQTLQPCEEDIFDISNRKRCAKYVLSMQRQLDKAVANGEKGKIRFISYLLTRVSKAVKVMSTQLLTDNSGSHTAGVDGVKIPKGIGTSAKNRQKMELMTQIDTKKKPDAIRRTYIPKPNGKEKRPLGIPTLLDRIIQDVIKTAIEPMVEYHFSHHSWGFRPSRGCADAMDHIFKKMSRKNCPQWVLEGDIKGCFDNIKHSAITEQLEQWYVPKQLVLIINRMLKADIMDGDISQHSFLGTPQGGVVSPMLANVAMHRLDQFCETVIRKTFKLQRNPIVRYADDFVVVCKTKEQALEIKGMIADFIKKTIGLELSEKKTLITHISEGFNFLSFSYRKYNGKMLIKPSKESVLLHSYELKQTMKQYKGSNLSTMLRKLNSQIIGWSNYYRGTVKTEVFSKLDNELWHGIWRWLSRLHPNKMAKWIRKKYEKFTSKQNRFTEHGVINAIHNDIKWTPHVMVKGGMRVYDTSALKYWEKREQKLAEDQMYSKVMEKLWKRQKGLCITCESSLSAMDIGNGKVHKHHCLPRSQGGDNSLNNLELLHSECHRKIHTLYTRRQMAYWYNMKLKYWGKKAVNERERELTV
jgi:RNA-directed DNA polymerase